jgi:hypothetical protein
MYLNKNWKISWSEQSFTDLEPEVLIMRTVLVHVIKNLYNFPDSFI